MLDLKTTFAGYHLHETLGSDAASTLYRATARGRDVGRGGGPRPVALLVSNVLDSDFERRQARVFQRKARAALDVNHPGVARVLDAGSDEGRVYLATAWRESVTLGQLIAARRRLTPDEAVDVLHLLARGLDAAHEAGLVHGALSTRTIRIDVGGTPGGGSAFVTGFGLDALLVGQLGSRRQRDTVPVPDDLLYVAPEQLRGGMTSAATDQYALACALYHCVTGQPPFVRDTAAALFGSHMFARPETTGVLDTDDNRALRMALATGLSKRPEDRHASCTRLLMAARDRQVGASAELGPTVAAGGATRSDRRAQAIAAIAAARSTLDATGKRIRRRTRSAVTAADGQLQGLPAPVLFVVAPLAGIVLAFLLFVLAVG